MNPSAALRHNFLTQNTPAPAIEPLRRIVAVGARSAATYGGSCPDSHDLTQVVDFLTAQGLIAKGPDQAPVIDLTIQNLDQGQDFLTATNNACDILLVCYVPGFSLMWEFENGGRNALRFNPADLHTSRFHDLAHWRNAVEQANPKVIVTVGGSEEIRTNHFMGMGYDPVQHSSRRNYAHLPRPNSKGRAGLNMWYGLMVREDLTDQLKQSNGIQHSALRKQISRQSRIRSYARKGGMIGNLQCLLLAAYDMTD